jgi:hypothetical protein
MLYEQSDLVAVVEVTKAVPGTTPQESSGRLLKTELEVVKALRGTTNGAKLDLFHWGSREPTEDSLSKGDRLIVFLDVSERYAGRRRATAYEVADYGPGSVRKLAPADLDVVVQRIEELATILNQERPNGAEVTEWLVRCAETPATRAEASRDLAAIAQYQRYQASDRFSKDDETSVLESYGSRYSFAEDASAPLTSQQKNRLVSAMLATQTLANEDVELMTLIGTWNDQRLLPVLISRLREMQDQQTSLTESLIRIAASMFDDDEDIERLAQAYFEVGTETSSDEESESDDDEEAAAETGEQAESEKENEVVSDDDLKNIAARRELLTKFIAGLEAASKRNKRAEHP